MGVFGNGFPFWASARILTLQQESHPVPTPLVDLPREGARGLCASRPGQPASCALGELFFSRWHGQFVVRHVLQAEQLFIHHGSTQWSVSWWLGAQRGHGTCSHPSGWHHAPIYSLLSWWHSCFPQSWPPTGQCQATLSTLYNRASDKSLPNASQRLPGYHKEAQGKG